MSMASQYGSPSSISGALACTRNQQHAQDEKHFEVRRYVDELVTKF